MQQVTAQLFHLQHPYPGKQEFDWTESSFRKKEKKISVTPSIMVKIVARKQLATKKSAINLNNIATLPIQMFTQIL